VAVMCEVLHGLHAVHEARDERGRPMNMVHRDVSLENVLVGVDGSARLVDFGVAKARGYTRTTQEGAIKGKLAYLAPERFRGVDASRASDVYAAGVVVWELLTGRRLFDDEDEAATIGKIMDDHVPPPSTMTLGEAAAVEAFDEVIRRATHPERASRHSSAVAFAEDLESCATPAARRRVVAFVEEEAHEALASRTAQLAEVERAATLEAGSVDTTEPSRQVPLVSEAPVVFTLVTGPSGDALGPRVDALLAWLAGRAGIAFERRDAPSYEALAADVRARDTDLAWLPPIVFTRLGTAVQSLGSILRGGRATYESALVVNAASRIKSIAQLRGTRAGWVDPWSAAGFVLPRIELALLGVDPRTLFRAERFHGSHRALLEALRDGACDVAGTYARSSKTGDVEAGAWSEVENVSVRVIATFGAIPPDVIAARSDLDDKTLESAREALRAATSNEEGKRLLHDVFGGDDLREGLAPGYEALRSALTMASARGLFD
jgi:phosphate/phosphite/phosphonate ABC transporter binding protein